MIDAPQVSLAKIGQRYYWTVYRRNMGIARIADGFADTREDAAQHAAAALEEAAPGFSERLLHLRLNADVWRCNFHVADEDIRTLARHPGKSFAWCRAFVADDRDANVLHELHHGELLGLNTEYTRDDVMRAFRKQAQQHHPDRGGDPAVFRRLVEAKDRALALAVVREREPA
jgi:hypothetical protein